MWRSHCASFDVPPCHSVRRADMMSVSIRTAISVTEKRLIGTVCGRGKKRGARGANSPDCKIHRCVRSNDRARGLVAAAGGGFDMPHRPTPIMVLAALLGAAWLPATRRCALGPGRAASTAGRAPVREPGDHHARRPGGPVADRLQLEPGAHPGRPPDRARPRAPRRCGSATWRRASTRPRCTSGR